MANTKFTLIVILLMTTPLLDGQDWNRFRGPNGKGTGDLPNLQHQITAADYIWARRLEGDGHSSPVLWENLIILTQTNPEGSERKVVCFDQKSGGILWQWQDQVIDHHKHRFNNFASATPVINAEQIFVVWTTGEKTEAIALSHSGELIWRRQWSGFSSDHGHAASPILVDDVLVFHTDAKHQRKSFLFGLDPDNGEVIWKIGRDTPEHHPKHLSAYNTPCVIESKTGPLILTLQSNDGWKAVSPTDGEVKWTFPKTYKYRSVASVMVDNHIAFASFGSGGGGKDAAAIKIENGVVTQLYRLGIKAGLPYVPTPIIHNGLIYLWADGGILTCRELTTGKEIYRERIGGNYFSSPILTGDRLINISRSGKLTMVSVGKKFKLLGSCQLENAGNVHATPAIASKGLVVRTDTHLIYINGDK